MAEAAPVLRRELRLWDLVFFNIAAVASVRWVAAAAHAGPGSISLWVLAIAGLLRAVGLRRVAAFAERFPDEGGLYVWTKHAFGDWHGFLCAWLYFLSNLLFVPSLALAAVAMSGYVWNADPAQLAQNRVYTLAGTLVLLWGAYLCHLFGLEHRQMGRQPWRAAHLHCPRWFWPWPPPGSPIATGASRTSI